jgi:uncharacterized protein with FMN-binding domain
MKKFIFSVGLIAASALYAVLMSQNSLSVALPSGAPSTAENIPSATSSPNPGNTIASGGNPVPTPSPSSTLASPPANTTPSTPSAPQPSTPAPTPAPKPVGLYTDGSYTGSVANAYYGNVQVKAVISGGKIADVQFLQYPNTHSTSVYINSQAMPYLRQEAIQAQSANVDIVSGATDTSMAFQQSLAAALAQAKI